MIINKDKIGTSVTFFKKIIQLNQNLPIIIIGMFNFVSSVL